MARGFTAEVGWGTEKAHPRRVGSGDAVTDGERPVGPSRHFRSKGWSVTAPSFVISTLSVELCSKVYFFGIWGVGFAVAWGSTVTTYRPGTAPSSLSNVPSRNVPSGAVAATASLPGGFFGCKMTQSLATGRPSAYRTLPETGTTEFTMAVGSPPPEE